MCGVVSYRNSTSNHNKLDTPLSITELYLIEILHQTTTYNILLFPLLELYLIEILHQTTTPFCILFPVYRLYLIEILHQTTTKRHTTKSFRSCILSKFYIKPQPTCTRLSSAISCILSKFYIKPQHFLRAVMRADVVSYRNSTSNHNFAGGYCSPYSVVSYRNSTSNHNSCLCISEETAVVSYRNSTSNHNVGPHID